MDREQRDADGEAAEGGVGIRLLGDREHDKDEHEREHRLGGEGARDGQGSEGVLAEAAGDGPAGLAARDEVQQPRCEDRPDDLRGDVGHEVAHRVAASGDESDGHCGVEVAAGDGPQGVGEHDEGEAEGKGDADVADGGHPIGEGAAKGHDGARTDEHEQEGADQFRDVLSGVPPVRQGAMGVGSSGLGDPLRDAIAGEAGVLGHCLPPCSIV